MSDRAELAQNAIGRQVPAVVNGKPQMPFLGVGKFQPRGRKAAPPICSSKDYPDNGDKRVTNLETRFAAMRFARRHGDLEPPSLAGRRQSCPNGA